MTSRILSVRRLNAELRDELGTDVASSSSSSSSSTASFSPGVPFAFVASTLPPGPKTTGTEERSRDWAFLLTSARRETWCREEELACRSRDWRTVKTYVL